MSRAWNEETARERIAARLAEVEKVEIREYVRDIDLRSLANGVVYRVDGVHMYVDILNIDEMLGVTDFEGVTAHRRTLRFLNLHFRAVRRILLAVDAIQVDFHNQRLHAVFAKPYGDEAARLRKAVASAQLVINVLAQTVEEGDDALPAASVRVGIDSGLAFAVNNGRRGNREPLFLGCPANLAAKRAGGGDSAGIFATNNARAALGLPAADDEDKTPLSFEEIEDCEDEARLDVSASSIVADWKREQVDHPIGAFGFAAHTPPFRNLDLESLTPSNSRRQEAVSIYADIDGFTAYVADRVDDDQSAEDVIRTLHVLRSELDSVLHGDFAGRKIRFIGDCVHGVMVEGTASTTDDAETARVALMCAAAMRSSFELALHELGAEGIDVGSLGLAIGLDFGPIAITRLGVKGERIRCCVSRAVLASEDEQSRCSGSQTAIGAALAKRAPEALRELFGASRRRSGFDYASALDATKAKASSAQTVGGRLLRPSTAAVAAAGFEFPNAAASPSKTPAGFA